MTTPCYDWLNHAGRFFYLLTINMVNQHFGGSSMKQKALIALAALMLTGTMAVGCVDKEKSQNTPMSQQERRDQRNQQRDSINPYPINRINPDGTKG